MKLFILLIYKNVIEQLRDVKRNSMLFIIPIAIFICFYGYFSLSEVELSFIKPIQVGVVIDDDTFYSQMLVDDFASKNELAKFFSLVQDDEALLRQRFENKELDGLVIIPEGYVDALVRFQNLPMEITIHNTDPLKTMILYNAFKGYEQYIQGIEVAIDAFYQGFYPQVESSVFYEYNDALSFELLSMVLNRQEMYTVDRLVDLPSVISITYYFIAITVMFTLYIALFAAVSLVEESREDSFMRMLTTKINLVHYIIAKGISYVLFIILIVFGWSGIFSLVSKKAFFFNSVEICIFFMLFVILAVLFSMLLTLFFTNVQDVVLFSSVFIFFTAIIGGSIIPIHYMPKGLSNISKVTPNYLAIKQMLMIHTGHLQGVSWVYAMMSFAIVLIAIVLINGYKYQIRRGSHG